MSISYPICVYKILTKKKTKDNDDDDPQMLRGTIIIANTKTTPIHH